MLENLSKVRIKEIELQCAKERIRELEEQLRLYEAAQKAEPGIHYCGHCGKPCRCEDDPWVRREGDCDCSKEDDRLREENARLRAEKRRPVDVGVGEWDRLRKLLDVPHEHPEGMNECYICDRSLVTVAAEEIEKLRAELERRYRIGWEAGVRRFAWWRFGVQYVGHPGKTLKDAFNESLTEE